MHSSTLCFLAVFLPLLSACLSWSVGLLMPKKFSAYFATSLMVIAALISWAVGHAFYTGAVKETHIHLWQWLELGILDIHFGIFYDVLTAIMVVVVNTVSALVHLYSIGYMSRDKTLPRFMSYLGLFTFFMLFLVTAGNFVQLFVGWEGVGLCSYLLIGYWYYKDSANEAAMKAFIVNRVGDLGFVLGIVACFFAFDTLDFSAVFAAIPFACESMTTIFTLPIHTITGICLLLFIGAMGKSAQFGLHIWLPDAMEGPTPVSALIHAATMVTAGVFMVVRLSPLFEASPVALSVIALVGILTALFAATVAMTQTDIKRVIAFSTCSQLGFMFFAVGVTAYGVAIFHLVTHAFFKALLFLGAGSVIHAMSDEQDMNQMGGLYRYIPITYGLMWVGSIALAGVPFFSGYYSKHAILDAVWGYERTGHALVGGIVYYGGLAATLLTALYSTRLMMLTFHGKLKANEEVVAHIHESPMVMLVPLFVLAMGSIFVGGFCYGNFVDNHGGFWHNALLWINQLKLVELALSASIFVKCIATVLAVLGVALGWLFYGPLLQTTTQAKNHAAALHAFLVNKWYIDELYKILILKPYAFLARVFWIRGDGRLIDGLGPNGVSVLTMHLGKLSARLQTGRLYHYLLMALLGILTLLWVMKI